MGMPKGIVRPPAKLGDGMQEFAVWLERDYERDEIVVRKIEPFDPNKTYPNSCTGVVQAKDELDVYNFIRRAVTHPDYPK